MADHRRPEHHWVLDYHQPGARTEGAPRLRRDDEEDDEDREDADREVPAGLELVEQLRDLYGPGPGAPGPLAAEIVRALGGELLAVELVMPGEVRGPLGGALAVVRVLPDGRCLLSVPEAGAQVAVAASVEQEEVVLTVPVEEAIVPPAGRAIVRHGDGLLLVRPVASPVPPRPRLTARTVVALVAGALLLVGLVVGALLVR